MANALANLNRRAGQAQSPVSVAQHLIIGCDNGRWPPAPTREQQAAIKRIDLITLATERRDFLVDCPKLWSIDAEGIAPRGRAYRWKPPVQNADELLAGMRRLEPHSRRAFETSALRQPSNAGTAQSILPSTSTVEACDGPPGTKGVASEGFR